MNSITKYNFPEVNLGSDFAKDKLKDFKTLIDASLSFVVISMPGVGVSYFLKYLATQSFAYFIHVDLYDLPTLSQHEFYKLLLSEVGGRPGSKTDEALLSEAKKILLNHSQKYPKIVIIFSRFDQLKKEFDWNFLSNIQSIATVSSGKVVLIFTSIKPLNEISSNSLSGGNLNFYSENLYFKPYSKEDLKKLLKIEHARTIPKNVLNKLLDQSGGHNQLLHILLSSQKLQNLLLDKFVKLQLKELTDYLDYQQKKQIQKIALGRKINEVDEYLLGVGMVHSPLRKASEGQGKNNYSLFTPLFAEYIKTNLPNKLPVKEAILFKLLRKNMDKIVTKDEIFTEVWPARQSFSKERKEDSEASDWALDALIYRLRKHPFMKSNGYIIESQKKVGYTLIQT